MNNDFSLEIGSLKLANGVDDKLKIFSFYYDLYNAIVIRLSSFNEVMANNYREFLSRTFQLTLVTLSIKDNKVDFNTFINSFFELLDASMISRMRFVKEIIDFHKDNLEEFVSKMEYVNSIDAMDLEFETKAKLIIIIREHINKVFTLFSDFYGEEESYDIRHKILSTLTNLIPTMLVDDVDTNLFRKRLKDETKIIIDNSGFDFLNYKDDSFKEFANYFDEIELQILLLGYPYLFAGFDKNDPDFEMMTIKEACQKLNISRTKYIIKSISAAIKLIKLGSKSPDNQGYSRKLK